MKKNENAVKTHLKWHATIPGTGVIVAMPQYNGTHSLTRLVLHAILSESGPIRACHYTRDNPWSLIVACQNLILFSL